MTILILGLLIFLGVHSVQIFAPDLRERGIARLGAGGWRGVYSLVSALGLLLIIWGYGIARLDPVVLYVPPTGLRHFSLALMLFVFPLLLATYLPGRIKAKVKHPMLASVKIWAFAHLLVNGTLADLLLFGTVLAWAVVDRISVKRRATAPVVTGGSTRNDVIAVVAGLALYVATVLFLHEWLIGVSPVA
ncbi:NnrU family protein [Methylobrevis albus]|uniref:NnrU family protein n=1 Tax=Methylobrevis albus TaxID=2793297 RepID=A0A931I6Y3_9HYPH|nr:NnrU family protein [Methylobrevis albus]MBH0239931.1 NnrU family protein [Methylobrevis albus]